MSTAKAQDRLQAAFDRLEAVARSLKDRAQGNVADESKVDALQAELNTARADNAELSKVTESASARIDAAVVRLRSVLHG